MALIGRDGGSQAQWPSRKDNDSDMPAIVPGRDDSPSPNRKSESLVTVTANVSAQAWSPAGVTVTEVTVPLSL